MESIPDWLMALASAAGSTAFTDEFCNACGGGMLGAAIDSSAAGVAAAEAPATDVG